VERPTSDFCVVEGLNTEVRVRYDRDPAGSRLYVADAAGRALLGLGSDALAPSMTPATTPTVAPAVTLGGTVTQPSAVAFDGQGYLWVADDRRILGFGPDELARGGSPRPRRTVAAVELTAPVAALAFDAKGALWVGQGGAGQLVGFSAEALARQSSPLVTVRLGGGQLRDVTALAFDSGGNLWVAALHEDAVLLYTAPRLARDSDGPAELRVAGLAEGSGAPLRGPVAMAFDGDDNLWVLYGESQVLARYTVPERATTGAASRTVTPAVQRSVGGAMSPQPGQSVGVAFDEAGGLWVPGSNGRLLRLDASELDGTAPSAARRELIPGGLMAARGLAFNPAPSALPLAY
jgi:ligand-binding sensor domain-containing protein